MKNKEQEIIEPKELRDDYKEGYQKAKQEMEKAKCLICGKSDVDLICSKCRSCDTCEDIIKSNNEHLIKEIEELNIKILEFQKVHDFGGDWENLCIENEIKQAQLQTTQNILDEIENIKNPYPEDIFLPISKEEYTAIHNLLLKHFNIPLDRISADLMRTARFILKEELKKSLGAEQ